MFLATNYPGRNNRTKGSTVYVPVTLVPLQLRMPVVWTEMIIIISIHHKIHHAHDLVRIDEISGRALFQGAPTEYRIGAGLCSRLPMACNMVDRTICNPTEDYTHRTRLRLLRCAVLQCSLSAQLAEFPPTSANALADTVKPHFTCHASLSFSGYLGHEK